VQRLEKWQWNSIIKAIEDAGLEPRDFDLDDDDGEARISLRGLGSIFVIGSTGSGGYEQSRAVGEGAQLGYPVPSWTALDLPLGLWLSEVKSDLKTPDRRAELRREREILTAATTEGNDNTPFTSDEQDEIATQLREINGYLKKTYELTANQAQALEAGLDDLRATAGRMGRREWFAYVVGSLTILDAVLPPETTRHVFLMLLRSLAHLHGFPELSGG
jgi:hypothetical protein